MSETPHELFKVSEDEFIVCDSDFVSNDVASELAMRLKRFVINIPGGKKNIETIDRKSLEIVLKATAPKENASV